MTRKTAITILKDIFADEIDPEEKLLAIQEVTDMETINSISKQNLVEVLRWIIEDYL